MSRALIGVCPARERVARARLFDALEEAFPVRFAGREPNAWRDLDGLMTFGAGDGRGSARCPRLELPADQVGTLGPGVPIVLGAMPAVPSMLAGQTIAECEDPRPITAPGRAATILATRSGKPVWTVREGCGGRVHHAALAPAELGPDEALRDRLRDGRFLALLALVRFLQELSAGQAYASPPLHAAFVLDDPNLHGKSYGYVHFDELVRDAEANSYHVSMAMIPFDGWFARRATVDVFRAHPRALSISMHGNDHLAGELERTRTPAEARSLLAQAVRRVRKFETRHALRVCRVMAPPHGVCSEQIAHQMVALGFEGLSVSRPFPWYARRPMRWTARPLGESPLAAWLPADAVAGGLPVLLRAGLPPGPGCLALRAFLGQPLIICGHHHDLAGGLDPLAAVAGQINALGEVRWMSLTGIARSRFGVRVDGRTLHVRLYSRRVTVDVPDGVDQIVVEVPPALADVGRDRVACGSHITRLVPDGSHAVSEPLVAGGSGALEISLPRADAIDPSEIPAPAWRAQPAVRRLATEGRDRLAPLVRPPSFTRR